MSVVSATAFVLYRLIHVKECLNVFVSAVVDIWYSGQWSPVHAGAANVEMPPVNHPEGGKEVTFGQSCHVHIVDFSI